MSSAPFFRRSVRLVAVCLVLGAACNAERAESPEREVVATSAALTASDCPAGTHIIQGNSSANTLNGTAGNDCILGLGGNDTINGLGGNDVLIGGNGRDTIRGGDGDDRIFGEADADFLYGDAGDDIIDGAGANDLIEGGDHNDVIQGGPQGDTINGGNGDDAILGGAGANTINGGAGTDRCSGTACELAQPVANGCTSNAQCSSPNLCVTDIGVCLPQWCTDSDGDGTCDTNDACPNDAPKIAPGVCGCAIADTDSDADGTPNCNDACASDPNKVAVGLCGCGIADTDSDADGTPNCNDACASDPNKVAVGLCGCGIADTDSDADGVANCNDVCLGFSDAQDADGDGVPDGCDNGCPPGVVVHQGDASVGGPNSPQELAGVGCITGSLTIANATDISALTALQRIDGSLQIAHNPDLADVDALAALTTVGGTVRIYDNGLLNLAGLANLSSVSTQAPASEVIDIYDNPSLPACWSWLVARQTGNYCTGQYDTYNQCWGNTGVGSCGELPPDFVCEPGADGPGVYDGYVFINAADAESRLNELGGVTCITDGLDIAYTELTNVDQLATLKAIGGSLSIHNNDELLDLRGLRNVQTAHATSGYGFYLGIMDNPQLPQCFADALEARLSPDSFDSYGNDNGASCTRIPQPGECVPGATGPGVYDGEVFFYYYADPSAFIAEHGHPKCITGDVHIESTDLTDLAFLSSVEAIGGQLYIGNNSQLSSLHGLENLAFTRGGLVLMDNDNLADVDPLAGLGYVDQRLSISYNDALASLNGLRQLELLGTVSSYPQLALSIHDNALLPACWVDVIETQTAQDCHQCYHTSGCEVVECSGNDGVGSCSQLPPGFACTPGASGPGVIDDDVWIAPWSGSEGYDLADLRGIECVTGLLYLDGVSATDLADLHSLSAAGSLFVTNSSLASVDGLENLTWIGSTLDISWNPSLTNLSGLRNLASLATVEGLYGRYLYIGTNPSLPACWVGVIEAQTGVSCGWGDGCPENDGAGVCE